MPLYLDCILVHLSIKACQEVLTRVEDKAALVKNRGEAKARLDSQIKYSRIIEVKVSTTTAAVAVEVDF